MPTLDQRIINATRPEMARTRSLIADRYVSPTEWDALVQVIYRTITMYTGKCNACGKLAKDCRRGYCQDCRNAFKAKNDAVEALTEALDQAHARDEWREQAEPVDNDKKRL